MQRLRNYIRELRNKSNKFRIKPIINIVAINQPWNIQKWIDSKNRYLINWIK